MEFLYRPLNQHQEEIRILELLPHHGWRNLRSIPTGYLTHISLNDQPKYLALSYVWGSEIKERVMLVNNQTLRITSNLYDAIMALRESDESVFIWIDAVCINQSDLDEKSWQIERMTEIYQRATMVVAWLGPSDQDSDEVMDYLESLGARAEDAGFTAYGGVPSLSEEQFAVSKESCRSFGEIPHAQIFVAELATFFHEGNNPLSAGFARLLQREWWSRVWVLQEITVPENVIFLCGQKKITRSRMTALVHAFVELRRSLVDLIDHEWPSQIKTPRVASWHNFFHRPHMMVSSWLIYRRRRFPLLALLRTTCYRIHAKIGPTDLLSTDNRDKIFALLNLSADREELRKNGVFSDYTKSWQSAYVTTMIALLQLGNFSALSYCQLSDEDCKLPTRVADWSKPVRLYLLQVISQNGSNLYSRFWAAGVESLDAPPQVNYNSMDRRVAILSQLYDEVSKVGHPGDRDSSYWTIKFLIESLCLTYENGNNYRSFVDRLCAAIRISIGGVHLAKRAEESIIRNEFYWSAAKVLQPLVEIMQELPVEQDARCFFEDPHNQKKLSNVKLTYGSLLQGINAMTRGRLPCMTRKGHLALCSEHVKLGDQVVLISGAQVPFILRPHGSAFQLVGEAYVDGIMTGGAVDISETRRVWLV